MSVNWDAVTAISSVAVAFGLLIAIHQLKIAQAQSKTAQEQLKAAIDQNTSTLSQISKDHERSRRELAIELMRAWTTSLDHKGSISRKLVETFDESQARKLFNQEELSLNDSTQKNLFSAAFDADLEADNRVSARQSAELRWRVITYLNALETILAAWHHNIADRDILEEQFKYLVSDRDGYSILANFRKAAGSNDTYPAIQAFVAHVQSKLRSAQAGKSAVG
jgi:hypothetical protein